MSRQIPLNLGHRAALGREDFLVAPGNHDAVAWLDLWPNWPAPGLVIYGPEASGKSHLAHVWQARSAAKILQAGAVVGDAPAILGDARAIAVEGLEGGVDERALLHLYNYLAGEGGSLLFTALVPVLRWPVRLPDLRSRLAALPAVAVGAPDDALIEAVMVKQFADRQLRVSPEVVAYLLPRLERSLAEVRRVVAALDAAGLAGQRAITIPLAKEVLHSLGISSAAVDPTTS